MNNSFCKFIEKTITLNERSKNIKSLSDKMFNSNNYDIDESYEEEIQKAYPNGINCKDDM